MTSGNDHAAAMKLARALTHMDDLASTATGHHAAQDAPAFLRKAR